MSAELVIGGGAHGMVLQTIVPNVVRKEVIAIRHEERLGTFLSADAIAEPASIKRLNDAGVPFVVQMLSSSGNIQSKTVSHFLERLVPLDTVLKSDEDVRRVVSQLVTAVAGMHAVDVFHGDIKTPNVMADPVSGDVRVVDFSLAHLDYNVRALEDEELYTINYRPPEMLLGYNHFDRIKADSWALGVTCCEIMLNETDGHHCLFQGTKWYHVLSAIMDAYPDSSHRRCFAFFPRWYTFEWQHFKRSGYWGMDMSLDTAVALLAGAQAADFIHHACDPEPDRRWSAQRLLEHPYISDFQWCKDVLKTIKTVPVITVVQRPIYTAYVVSECQQKKVDRDAIVEELLRFIEIDAADKSAYEGALVLVSYMSKDRGSYLRNFVPDNVMRILCHPKTVEFFSRRVRVSPAVSE